MKKLFFISTFILLWPLSGYAQDVARYEVSGGFSNLRESQLFKARNYPGWDFSISRNYKNWFAMEAEFSGHYKNFREGLGCITGCITPPPTIVFSERIRSSDHLFMTGPRFSYRKIDRVTLFAHALVGARYDRTSITVGEPPGAFKAARTSFAVGAGGGVDVNVTKSFGIRALQADYIHSGHPFALDRNDLRLSSGVVFRFGK